MEDARVTLDTGTKRKYVKLLQLGVFKEISTSKKMIQSFVLTHKKVIDAALFSVLNCYYFQFVFHGHKRVSFFLR